MARAGWIAALSAGAVLVGGVAVYAQADSEPVTVERVIDGDTIDVRLEGETQRVRLLNVDTPETKHPNKEIECLGPEATEFLEEQLPVGQEIELEFDQERTDRYDRVLAGVFKDGELINAEIARAGLGVAVSYGSNTRFYPEVQSAQEEAETQGSGLFDESVDCTVAAVLSAAEGQVAAVPEELAEEIAGIEEQLVAILAAAAAVSAAQDSLAVLAEFPEAAVARAYSDRADGLKKALRDDAETISNMEDKADERVEAIEEEERQEKERQEEERRAEREKAEREEAEQAAAEQAETERREAERAAEAEAERQREAQQPAPQPQPAPATQPTPQPAPSSQPAPQPQPAPQRTSAPEPAPAPSQNSGGGMPNMGPDERPAGYMHKNDPTGYTGPRCFLPGGQWWKPC